METIKKKEWKLNHLKSLSLQQIIDDYSIDVNMFFLPVTS